MIPTHTPAPGLHLWNASSTGPSAGSLAAARFWAIPALALLTLALLTLNGANSRAFLFINTFAAALPGGFWANITSLGDTLVAFAILLPLISRRPEAAAAAILAVVFATLGTHGLKYAFEVARPPAVLDANLFHAIGPLLHSRSLPSGHTAAAFTVAALICGHTASPRLALAIVALATLIGVSRIAVGAHWPADVLAGAALGWLAGFAGIHLTPYCRRCQSKAVHWFALALFCAATLWLLTGFNSGYADARWLERTVAAAALLFLLLSLFGKRIAPLSRP